MKIIKRNQTKILELKSTIKNKKFSRFSRRFGEAENRIRKPEYRIIEII